MHPHTPTTISGRACLTRASSPRSENALSSGFLRTLQVLSSITCASRRFSVRSNPMDCRESAICSLSSSFIWHPHVWMANVPRRTVVRGVEVGINSGVVRLKGSDKVTAGTLREPGAL